MIENSLMAYFIPILYFILNIIIYDIMSYLALLLLLSHILLLLLFHVTTLLPLCPLRPQSCEFPDTSHLRVIEDRPM